MPTRGFNVLLPSKSTEPATRAAGRYPSVSWRYKAGLADHLVGMGVI